MGSARKKGPLCKSVSLGVVNILCREAESRAQNLSRSLSPFHTLFRQLRRVKSVKWTLFLLFLKWFKFRPLIYTRQTKTTESVRNSKTLIAYSMLCFKPRQKCRAWLHSYSAKQFIWIKIRTKQNRDQIYTRQWAKLNRSSLDLSKCETNDNVKMNGSRKQEVFNLILLKTGNDFETFAIIVLW